MVGQLRSSYDDAQAFIVLNTRADAPYTSFFIVHIYSSTFVHLHTSGLLNGPAHCLLRGVKD